MAEQRLACDQEGCEKPAEVFGFHGDLRNKACLGHILERIGEGEKFYRISAYAFIDTPDNGQKYLEWKDRMEKGKEHLKALGARCDQEWEKGYYELKQALMGVNEALKQTSEELERRARNHYHQVKQQLKSRESHFEQLVVDRDFQLKADDAALCEAIPDKPVLQVSLGDCKEQLAQLLLAHFKVLPEERVEAELKAEGPEKDLSANEAQDPDDTSARKKPRRLRHVAEAISIAQNYLIEGKEAREAGEYEQALEHLKGARKLLNFQGHDDTELSLQLGLTLLHFGQREEAERELRRGLYPEFDPEDDLSVQVQIALAELYFQTGQWEETIKECEPVESQWQGSADSYELTKTLFFLVHSYYQLNRRQEGDDLIKKWAERLHASNSPSTLLLITGEKYRAAGNQSAAAECYEAGLQNNKVPVSYVTIVSKLCLGTIYEDMERLGDANDQYKEASSLSFLHYPNSFFHQIYKSKFEEEPVSRRKRPRSSSANEEDEIRRSP